MKLVHLLIALTVSLLLAADFPVAGFVTNDNNTPIVGATIEVSGSTEFTESDALGGFGNYSDLSSLSKGSITQKNSPSVRGNALYWYASRTDERVDITLTDVRGRMLFSKSVKATQAGSVKTHLQLGAIADGLYLLRLQSDFQSHVVTCRPGGSPAGMVVPQMEKANRASRAAGDSIYVSKHGYLPETVAVQTGLNTVSLTSREHSSCGVTYEQSEGNSWHYVGQDQWVNTFRGVYWVGETKSICRSDLHLNFVGDVSSYGYKVTVWEVDPQNDLELITLLATSDTVSGSFIEAGGSWVTFTFAEPVTITSGKTAILVSRDDTTQYSRENILCVSNNYDENDEENDQFNVHYSGNKLAGRKPGDEDQPEPFAFDIRLYGEKKRVTVESEVPAQPLNISAVDNGNQTATISWDDFNVAVDVASYNVYSYNMEDASETLLATTPQRAYTTDVQTAGTTLNIVVRGVSFKGVESYHTDIATITLQ